jgi:hypothetical protein
VRPRALAYLRSPRDFPARWSGGRVAEGTGLLRAFGLFRLSPPLSFPARLHPAAAYLLAPPFPPQSA